MKERNLTQPGVMRYQPTTTKQIFGYDNECIPELEVEWAVLETFAEVGVIPPSATKLLTPALKAYLLEKITTTAIKKLEDEDTEHYIGALTRLVVKYLPPELKPYVHLTLTSEDVLCTAIAMRFQRAHKALKPLIREVVKQLGEKIHVHRRDVKMARTHGQHAVPITFGAEFAPTLERIMESAQEMEKLVQRIPGKISGPIGTYGAQMAIELPQACHGLSFEKRVLRRLGVRSDVCATQLTLPEALARYLNECVLFSNVFGQLGRNVRHLMRAEIAEVSEEVMPGRVGSSAMPHKKCNPKDWEQLDGMSDLASAEYAKVLMTLKSEHARDLTGSSIRRFFPTIVIIVAHQLETLLRKKGGKTLIERMRFETLRAKERVHFKGRSTLAEPLYCVLARAGHPDAHRLVREKIAPLIQSLGPWQALEYVASRECDPHLHAAIANMPQTAKEILSLGHAPHYIGNAEEIATVVSVRAIGFATAYK